MMDVRPLVTFALMAYNQERFIRAAVEAAFAQDYSPLEIILSDDCSSDETFMIISEMVEEYTGVHKLIVNKNKSNIGIGAHIRKISEFANGEILVLAAGDDISFSCRVREVVNAFSANSNVFAVFSDLAQIDEQGSVVNQHVSCWKPLRPLTRVDLTVNGGGVAAGATYAYRKKCFSWPWSYPEFLINEDRILPYRAAILGEVFYINKVLVKYRLSLAGLSRSLPPKLLLAHLKDDHLAEIVATINYSRDGKLISKKEAVKLLSILVELKFISNLIFKFDSTPGYLPRFLIMILYNILHRRTFIFRFQLKIFRFLKND